MASSGTKGPTVAARLLRGQEGQAAVETMFALTVVVFIILAVAQLFVISDLAMGVMGAAHYQGTRDAHALDDAQTFRYVDSQYSREVSALPGVEMALAHFGQGGTAASYGVRRRVRVAAGAFTGPGLSAFGDQGDGMGLGHSGARSGNMVDPGFVAPYW